MAATERPTRPLAARATSAAGDKQAKAQRALNEAIESHDIGMLKKAITQAASAGIAPEEIESGQRVLDFEVNKELFQDLLGVRTSVDALAQTVQKVEAQVKLVSGGVATDRTTSAEVWLSTIVKQVEAQLWESLEKRVEEKVRQAVARATSEISKSTKELSGLLNTVIGAESGKSTGKASMSMGKKIKRKSMAMGNEMGLDSQSDSSDSDTAEGQWLSKGKGKGKSKSKSFMDTSTSNEKKQASGLMPDAIQVVDTDHQHHLNPNQHLPHGHSNERRPSLLASRPSVTNSRVGEALGLTKDESIGNAPVEEAEEKLPEKPRKIPDVSGLHSIFMNKEENIQCVLSGEGLPGSEEDDMMTQVPAMLEEPQNWGLRVKDVKKFYDYIRRDLFGYVKKAQQDGDDWHENLHVVTPRFIKPWTKAFAPYSLAGVINAENLCNLKINSLEEIMTARIFISHCWNENFGDFVSTMTSILEPDDTVWVCAISICQNVDISSILGDRIEDSPFWRAMPHCRRVAMLIDRNAEPFERAWCALEEYLATYKLRLPFSICMPDTMDEEAWNEVDRKLQNFSIRECKASEESDKRKIMEIIGDKADIIDRVIRDESQKACFAARVMKVATSGTIDELLPLAMHALAQVADGAGRSILHICAQMGKADQLKDLLKHDLPLDCRDQAGKAPLHFAAELGEEAVTKILIEGRAQVNLKDNLKWTPLSFAANKGQVAIVPLLVNASADIDSPDSDGFTPLLSAAVEGFAHVERELIRLRASLEVRDSYGHSALTLASQANYVDVVNVLIEAGMNLDETDVDGCTPLMYASGFGYTQVVKSLLNGGASTTVKDLQEYTALDFAQDEKHQEIINLLVGHQAWEPNLAASPDKSGSAPML